MNENITGLMFAIVTPFLVTQHEAQDWADEQSVGTIHDITVRGDHVIVTPMWEEDFNKPTVINWCESFHDHFAEKMQEN